MMEKSKKNLFLMYKLEILNTFLMAWMTAVPLFGVFLGGGDDSLGWGYFILYLPLCLFFNWIFGLIFKKFLNKKKKLAIYMSFILDIFFLFAWKYFLGISIVEIVKVVKLGSWLSASNAIILLLHVLVTIKVIKRFDEDCVLQNFEEYDKKDLLDSLIVSMWFNIVLVIASFALLLSDDNNDILIWAYAFLRLIVIATWLLAFVTTVKEKKSLAIFNIVFATINTIFTFNPLEIRLGVLHLETITNYLNKEDDEEDENEGYSSE